jgi:hypothetical protein
MNGDHPDKKDLTSIMDLPQADPVKREGQDQEEFNELHPIDQINDFESLDQIGMMDHPTPPDEAPAETIDPAEDPASSIIPDPLPAQPEMSSSAQIDFGTLPDPFNAAEFDNPVETIPGPEVSVPVIEDAFPGDPFQAESTPPQESDPAIRSKTFPTKPILEELKSYSEAKKSAPFDPGVRNQFNLIIGGDFDPYSRDKLLLFITENPIGLSSSELDFQINGKRVLLPRISEFSGVKLIQELRDTGLSFRLNRSTDDSDTRTIEHEQQRFQYQTEHQPNLDQEIPILSLEMLKNEEFIVLDSIQMVQYLRAEILEVEKSELFQDLLERMTHALKRRAKLKGANALTQLEHRITPLRLPSQYQIEISASLIKRHGP